MLLNIQQKLKKACLNTLTDTPELPHENDMFNWLCGSPQYAVIKVTEGDDTLQHVSPNYRDVVVAKYGFLVWTI